MPTTTSFNRAAVVLLPFPFSDQSAAKLRLAVILNPNYPSEDLLVVAVSSISDSLRPGEFALQFWREAGLIRPSFVKRALSSVLSSLVRRRLSQLRAHDLTRLDSALRLWLGL